MKAFQKLTIVCLIMTATSAFAADSVQTKQNKKKPVQDAPKVQKGYVPKSEITITEGKGELIKEYRINGQLRAIKVTPNNGFPAYYLIDREGTGEFVKIGPDMGENIVIPTWILFEW